MIKDFVIGAFLFPIEAYFTPETFRARIEAEIPRGYTLLEALRSTPQVRRKVLQFLVQLCFAMVCIPLIVTLVAFFLIPNANIAFMLDGALLSLTTGVVFGILPRILTPFTWIMAASVGFGVVTGSVLGVSSGIYSSIAQSTIPSAIARVVDSPEGQMANALLLGVTFGVVVRIAISVRARHMREAMLAGLIILVPIAFLLALLSKPEVASTNRLFAVCAIMAFTGWLILPLQLLIAILNRLILKRRPSLAPLLWQITPINWDDYLIVPMPDTVPLLLALYESNRDLYRKAFSRVQRHAFQSRFAKQAQQVIVSQ